MTGDWLSGPERQVAHRQGDEEADRGDGGAGQEGQVESADESGLRENASGRVKVRGAALAAQHADGDGLSKPAGREPAAHMITDHLHRALGKVGTKMGTTGTVLASTPPPGGHPPAI